MKVSKRKLLGSLCILVGILLICLYFVSTNVSKKTEVKSNSVYEDIVLWEDDTSVYLNKDFIKELQESFNNKNIIGYVVYKEANISYPIVKSEDNVDYLYKDIKGNYNASGSIFLDCFNSNDFSDVNSVIYGHHMNNGSMFGSLEKHINEKGISSDETVYIYTPNERREYSCVASEIIDPDSENSIKYLTTNNREDFLSWLNYSSSNCKLLNIDDESNFLTLITCHYSGLKVDRFGLTCEYIGSKNYKVKEE